MESHSLFHTSLSSFSTKYCKVDGSPEQQNEGTYPKITKNSSLEDEVIKSKIEAYLNEKALKFKKLEKALREEVYRSTGHDKASSSLGFSERQKLKWKEELDQELMKMRGLHNSTGHDEASLSLGFSERQKLKWKEELDQELMRMREMRRQASARGKTPSPNQALKRGHGQRVGTKSSGC